MTDRKIMIADLGRRHPAATDDVDVILAMPRSDADNEGLLADECWHDLIEKDDRNSPEDYPDHALITKDELAAYIVRALRAIPSPDTMGVRSALEVVRHKMNRLKETQCVRSGQMEESLLYGLHGAVERYLVTLSPSHCMVERREKLREALVKALDGHTEFSRDCSLSGEYLCSLIWPIVSVTLSPSHCTSARREEIEKRAVRLSHKWGAGGNHAEMMVAFAMQELALSEQSGPTAVEQENDPWKREMKTARAFIAAHTPPDRSGEPE